MRELEETLSPVFEVCAANATGPIGLAVSGGGDSLALLYIASQWAKESGQALFCLTVDHGLRAAAADEAKTVGVHCDRLGLSHQILKWTPDQQHIGQARSRRARHILLAKAAREMGGDLILMGHTQDDQAETRLMREARRAQGYGLAGIRSFAISPTWPEGRGVNIGRPLLGVQRADLRTYLRSHSVDWIDDPSNLDSRYERVRVRETLCSGAALSKQDTVTKAALSAWQARSACDQKLAAWFRDGVKTYDDGLIRFDPLRLREFGLDQEEFGEGLAWLLMCAGGHDRRANRESRQKLAGDILASPHGFQACTLGGAWIAPRKKQVTLARDPGRAAPMPQEIETAQVWDGRFLLMPVKQDANDRKTGLNTPYSAKLTDISPMARETYPSVGPARIEVSCLIRQRLNQLVFMFDCDNLMNLSTKKGLGPSLHKV